MRLRHQGGLSQHLTSLSIEEARKVGLQYIHDNKGRTLRDPGVILQRWTRLFYAFFNSKYDKLRLDIIEGLPQWPVTHAIGGESSENEITAALR